MNKRIFLAAAVMGLGTVGCVALPLPIQNGVLTGSLNANGQAVTNVGSLTFADGTRQSTAAGASGQAPHIVTMVTNTFYVFSGAGTSIVNGNYYYSAAGFTNSGGCYFSTNGLPTVVVYQASNGTMYYAATNGMLGTWGNVWYSGGNPVGTSGGGPAPTVTIGQSVSVNLNVTNIQTQTLTFGDGTVQSTAGGFTGTLTNLAPPTLVITTNYQLWVNTSDSAELCGFFFTNGTLTAGSPVFTNSFGASIFLSSVNSTQGIWNLNFPDNSPDAISDWLLIGATDPSAAQWGANLTVERAACYITNATAFNVVTFSNGICETNQTTTYSPGQTFALLTAGGGNAGIPGFSGTVTNLAPPTVAYSTNTFIQVSGSGLAPVNDNTYETNASFGSAYGYPIYVNASQTEQILFWEAAPFGLQAGQSGWIIATNGYDQNGNTPVYFLSEGVVASPDLATNWLSVLADSGGNLNPNPLNNPRPTVVAVVTISTNWVRPFNIATFINGVCVTNTTGTLPAAALPPSVVTNNQARVNFGALNFFSGYEYGCITNTTPDSIDLYGQPGDSGAANITLHGDPTFPSSEAILGAGVLFGNGAGGAGAIVFTNRYGFGSGLNWAISSADGSAYFANGAVTIGTNGSVTASNFGGNGGRLTNLNAANLVGTVPASNLGANLSAWSAGAVLGVLAPTNIPVNTVVSAGAGLTVVSNSSAGVQTYTVSGISSNMLLSMAGAVIAGSNYLTTLPGNVVTNGQANVVLGGASFTLTNAGGTAATIKLEAMPGILQSIQASPSGLVAAGVLLNNGTLTANTINLSNGGTITGSGANLTNLNAASLTGTEPLGAVNGAVLTNNGTANLTGLSVSNAPIPFIAPQYSGIGFYSTYGGATANAWLYYNAKNGYGFGTTDTNGNQVPVNLTGFFAGNGSGLTNNAPLSALGPYSLVSSNAAAAMIAAAPVSSNLVSTTPLMPALDGTGTNLWINCANFGAAVFFEYQASNNVLLNVTNVYPGSMWSLAICNTNKAANVTIYMPTNWTSFNTTNGLSVSGGNYFFVLSSNHLARVAWRTNYVGQEVSWTLYQP